MALTVVDANPIKVTGTTSEAAEVTAMDHLVNAVRLEGCSAADHLATLTDTAGHHICTLRAPADLGAVQQQLHRLPARGIKCSDLDSGTLLIYVA